jgi:hypothetical protein
MTPSPLPLRILLYRYFFYGWLFRDAWRGTLWERSAATRHNVEQARWLPTYMRRWGVLCLGLFALGVLTEVPLSMPQGSVVFYLPSVASVPFIGVTAVCWLFLTRHRTF